MSQKRRKGKIRMLASAGLLAISIPNVPEATAAEIDQLEAQMRAMQVQLEELKRQVDEAKAQAVTAKTSSVNGVGDDALDLKVKWKGAPELSSADGKFKFKVRGRLNVDYNGIDQDEAITGDPDVSAIELRRARLGVEGVMFYDWVYKFEVDFAGDETAIKDAYIEYTGLPVDLRAVTSRPTTRSKR